MPSVVQALKVLLVDDDSSLLETLAEYVRASLHAVVITAASVPGALKEIAEEGPFDVIVSDYQIPPHTALDLAHHMKRSKDKTPLILHSGFHKIDESQFAGESYLGLVPKPENRALVKLIAEHFPQAKKKS